MDKFIHILNWINNGIIVLFTVAFGIQMLYILLFFLKPKQYKKARTNHSFAIIICARNEAKIIGKTISNIFQTLDYPRDKYDIIVVADNCSDNTKELAEKAGAIVLERNKLEQASKGYALQYAFQYLMDNNIAYESYCIFDADTIPHSDYLNKMNDAFECGETIANCNLHSQNFTQNMPAGISSLWYLRDCRFTCSTRSALGLPNILSGHGIMIAHSVIAEVGGWDSVGLLEDAEFTVNRVLEGKNIGYVKDAIIYDDNPSTIKDTFKRNVRMGNGLNKLFYKKGGSLLAKFFTTFKFRYIDMFFSLFFATVAVIAIAWFPAFYITDFIYKYLTDFDLFIKSVNILWRVLLYSFIIPFIVQGLLALLLERKRLKGLKWYKLILYAICLPFYMIIYALGIAYGACSKKVEWKNISRNVEFVNKMESNITTTDNDITSNEKDK